MSFTMLASPASIDALRPGDHLCLLYDSDEQHRRALTAFLLQGLERGERVLYISQPARHETVLSYLRDAGHDPAPRLQGGQLALLDVDGVYARDGDLDPDDMLARLRAEAARSEADGYPAMRLTGEMGWALGKVRGAEPLIEYEARLNEFLPGSRCIALCQYDQRLFPPQTLLDALHSHPQAILNGQVVRNDFYVPPAEFLGPSRAAKVLARETDMLLERHRAETALLDQSRIVAALMESTEDSISVIDPQSSLLDCNAVMAHWLGTEREALIGRPVYALLTPEVRARRDAWVQQVVQSRKALRVQDHRSGRHLDTVIHPVCDERGEVTRLVVVARDVTERVRAEETLHTVQRFLEIANCNLDMQSLLDKYVAEVQAFSGCEAVGVRILDEAGNIPYLAYAGFSPAFYERESPLSIHSDRCMCINVVKGTTDPAQPFYTPGGSFYSNGTTRLLATVSEADKGSTRNVCNQVGYESVALCPISFGGRILGLVHVADPRTDMLPLSKVELLESVCARLGSAIARVVAEQEVRRHRDHLQELVAEQTTQLSQANAQLKGEVVWHERIGLAARRRNALLDAINTLLGHALTCQSAAEVARMGLEAAAALTGSDYGYVSEITPAGARGAIVFTTSTNAACQMPEGQTRRLPGDLPLRGFTGRVVNDRRPLIANQPQTSPDWVDLPEGHPAIRAYLGVPLLDGERIVGVLALANKPGGYDDQDLADVEQLTAVLTSAYTRKRAEEALRQSEERYRVLVQAANEGVWAMNGQYETTFVNARMAAMLGYSVDEMLGRHVTEFMPPEELADHNDKMRARRVGQSSLYERRFLRKDGSILPTLVSASALLDGENRFAGGVALFTDISELKRAEEMMLKTSRLQATTTLAGGVAHDFNNLMAVVLGNAEMLRMYYSREDEAQDMVGEVARAAQRAGELAQQLLAYARGGKYQVQPVSLNDTVDQVLRIQGAAAPPRIRLTRDLDPALPLVKGDPTQLAQVVTNLCINAVEAISGSGFIRVTTRDLSLDATSAADLGLPFGRYAYLEVEDSGSGMTPEVQSHLFEPFYTTKFTGRGLGLAAAYGIVQNHGGRITASSVVGQGSVFRVYLPALEPAPAPPAAEQACSPSHGETILVIDDEPMVLHVTQRMLEQMGYLVLQAANGEQALALARDATQPIQLALLDLGMPGMGGADLYPLLRQLRPSLRVLISSGYELDSTAQALLDAGAVAFMQKPYRFDELACTIRAALSEA